MNIFKVGVSYTLYVNRTYKLNGESLLSQLPRYLERIVSFLTKYVYKTKKKAIRIQ